MKKKNKKAQLKRKKEFRFHRINLPSDEARNKKMMHPAYVFLEKGNIFIYVTLTHSSQVKNHIVIKLRKNPNPKDQSDAYVVDEIREDTKDKFSRRLSDWELDPLDDAFIRKLKKDDSAT